MNLNAADFLREYFRGTQGRIYLGAIRNAKSTLPRGEIGCARTRNSGEVNKFVTDYDKPEQDCAIYYCTATIRDGRASREAADCWQFPSLFADCDDHNHDLDRASVIELLEALKSPPTMIVNSGHGLQPHWLLAEPSENAERIIAARKKLQAILASDKVHDAPRYMRLPGSHNSKDGWLPVEVVSHHPERRYALEVLEEWLDTADVIIPRKAKAKGNGKADKPFVLPPSNGPTIDDKRGAAWAAKALEASATELANAPEGSRHATLRDKTIRMATMIARNWIDMQEVRRALFAAAQACGQIKDYGVAHFDETFAAGIKYGMQRPHADLPNDDAPRGSNGVPHAAVTETINDAPHQSRSKAQLLRSARASTFEVKAIQWLWPNRFALGKLGLLGGLPDQGKGQVLGDMAARVTRELEWPCGEGRAPQGNVVLLTAEDDPNDTVVPRLIAAGADLDRIEIVSMVSVSNKERMFSLMTDLDLLRQKIAEVGDVRMIQIDPISAYLGIGKIDSFRTTDVRAVLGPVIDLAAEQKVAIVGLMHFNKKTDVTNAMLRISDSLAFVAAARHCYVVVDDKDNNRKLFLRAKNNLAPDHKALAYGFGVRAIGHDRQTGVTIEAPHIVWHPQQVDITATEAMEAAATGQTSHTQARDDAKKFLADMLASGPVQKSDIEEAAEANCISERTLWRAKADLGIVAKKAGLNAGWTWELPQMQNWRI